MIERVPARWQRAATIGTVAVVAGIGLFPARYAGAPDPWFGLDSSDALRYIAMANDDDVEYPWGGRWLIPSVASTFGESATTALRTLNYMFLYAATIVLSYLGLRRGVSSAAVGAAWIFIATGAAYPLLFQNPYLLDSAGLLIVTLIGLAFLRGRDGAVLTLIVVGVTIKEIVIGFLVLSALRRRWGLLAAGVALSAALLLYGRHRSSPGAALLPDLGFGMIVKGWFGLGASWILLAAAVWAALARYRSRTHEPISSAAQFYSVTVVLALAALPIATDTSRLLVFMLPAVLPIISVVLASTGRLLFAVIVAVPAALVVIPTRVSLWAKPEVMSQLEQWYSANPILIGATSLLAAAGATVLALRYLTIETSAGEVPHEIR